MDKTINSQQNSHYIFPQYRIARTSNYNQFGNGCYCSRIVISEFDFLKLKKLKQVDESLDNLRKKYSISCHEPKVTFDFMRGMHEYAEFSISGYNHEDNNKIMAEMESIVKNACDSLNIPYIEPEITPIQKLNRA